jgi:hypothetical protein
MKIMMTLITQWANLTVAMVWKTQNSNQDRDSKVSLHKGLPERLWIPRSLLYLTSVAGPRGIKLWGGEFDPSVPFSGELKNGWGCIYTLLYASMAWTMSTLPQFVVFSILSWLFVSEAQIFFFQSFDLYTTYFSITCIFWAYFEGRLPITFKTIPRWNRVYS